jgi:hypothetical protein
MSELDAPHGKAIHPLVRDDMKVLYYCEGAPRVCKGCRDRRQCQYWNHYIRRLVYTAIYKRIHGGKESLLYVRTIARKVHHQSHRETLHWLYPIVDAAIRSLPGVEFYGYGRTRGAKNSIAAKIYRVKASEVL